MLSFVILDSAKYFASIKYDFIQGTVFWLSLASLTTQISSGL